MIKVKVDHVKEVENREIVTESVDRIEEKTLRRDRTCSASVLGVPSLAFMDMDV
jgi:hypothetical protein